MSSPPAARGHGRRWPIGPRPTALLIAICVGVGITGGLALRSPGNARPHGPQLVSAPTRALEADAVWRPGQRAAPPFALRDQANRLVSLSAQRGRAVLLAFMDSHCKLICSLEGPMLHSVLRRVGATEPVTLLVVSVNPWEDTAASTRAAVAHWRIAGDWHWLRGSTARLRPVWRSYGIAVVRTPSDVNHSTAIYLVDGRGYERAGFNWPFTAGPVVHNLRALFPSPGS